MEMKDLIKSVIKEYLNEAFVRSNLPSEKRYNLVADKIIEFMEMENTTSIPDYSTLANWKPEPGSDYKPNMKYLLQKYLIKNEYFQKVVPLIKFLKPNFTTSSQPRRHRVDDDIVVFSNGEKIVYNTFKMNGIKLIPQPKQYEFEYVYKGKTRIKKPDFLWKKENNLIEVAGLEDASYGTDYMEKLKSAKDQIEKQGILMTILDYYSYRKNLQGFYKYVCQTFGFPYDPMDFWTANMVQDLPIEDLKREVNDLILKGTAKKYGEQFRQNKIITQLLTKPGEDGSKPEGYKSVWEYRQETGVGMRWADPELRKQVQKAWCKSTGSNQKTYEMFRELFPGIPFSKTTVENMRSKYPAEFDQQKRDEICNKIN
jgi:hypothetical protein